MEQENRSVLIGFIAGIVTTLSALAAIFELSTRDYVRPKLPVVEPPKKPS